MADISQTLKDAAYVGIGFGVITFQRAQVRRQELKKQLESQLEGVQGQLEAVLTDVEGNVDKALDELATRLPEPAREALATARTAGRDVATQLRSRVA